MTPSAEPSIETLEPEPDTTDGRQLRRRRNRQAVVEALLDLYRDGNLRPSAEEIATRSGLSPRSLFRYFDDVDDLIRTAVSRQEELALPLVSVDVGPEAPLEIRVRSLVDQRFRLYQAVGNAAAVSRLRAPFEPVLAAELRRNRNFLRTQLLGLFGAELTELGTPGGPSALAAIDVLTSFESLQLLLHDQVLSEIDAKEVVAGAVLTILRPPG